MKKVPLPEWCVSVKKAMVGSVLLCFMIIPLYKNLRDLRMKLE